MLCLLLCLLTGAKLPAPGTPDTSYMQVVSPRIRAAQKMCCGMCCGKFGFLPQTCLKQSHASAFLTTPNDSLSVPRVIQKAPGPSKSPRNRDHHWKVASSRLQVHSQCANGRKSTVGGSVGGEQTNTNTENPSNHRAFDRLRWWISSR